MRRYLRNLVLSIFFAVTLLILGPVALVVGAVFMVGLGVVGKFDII